MEYGYTKRIADEFDVGLARTKNALATEGFGILTEIDVAATMKKKLNEDYDSYVILGACNPSLAHKALGAEKQIGLLLPCNVIVYREGEETVVSAVRPSVAMHMVDNPALEDIARDVEEKLKHAVDAI